MNNLNSDISLSKEEIAAMEPITYPGTIVVVQSEEGACKAVEYLRMQSYIGFDTETKPAFKKGQINKVALLQLSGGDYCFLFRLNKIGFPECVIKLLSDKNILKIGLSLKDD